ncbi:S-layer homology domain-containing protein [Tumebacillus permanentifrigoris]|uniref:S-layer family protein n=1 Tax=Tumebacillus permanentifrigoris TaxID=378543 RepID=A0A316DG67_9BACL|nr:S-layer homology domain-containing protein [Tumebacillus permanentifrigoris]PWK16229.1 S-layer family protein [Tumebacillus permanentifrigoris]
MARKQSRLLSLLVALVMLLTLIPVFPAQAASSQYFTFPSFGKTPLEAQNNPVNVDVIDQFNGVFSQTVPQTLSYKVQQQVLDAGGNWSDKGVPKIVANTTPIISGPSNQEFAIQKVQLFIGMNKITVSTPSGVEGVCYVFYDNAPVIFDISLNNGDKLNGSSIPYVDVADQFFIIKTANADSVVVGSTIATKYGSGAFSVSNYHLDPGLNTLTFVAKSDTRQYTLTRQIIYVNGPGALYGVYMQSDINNSANDAVQIDGVKVLSSQNALPQGLKGTISVPSNAVIDPQLAFTNVKLTRDGNSVFSHPITDPELAGKITLLPPKDDKKGHMTYDFFIDLSAIAAGGSWPIKSNGTYTFYLDGKYYDGSNQLKTLQGTVAFVFKDSSKASIADVQQLFGVDESNDTGGVAGKFSRSISNLPIYALITAQNNAGDFTPQISVTQNGTPVNLVQGTDYILLNKDITPNKGSAKIKILKLPFVNDMTLNFSIVDSGNTDNFQPLALKYTPIPSIVLYNIYDGDNYALTDLPDFSGKLFNFVSDTEKQNIKVTVNGAVKHAIIDLTTNRFTVKNLDPAAPNQLQGILNEGANEVIVEGTSQGIPVITRLTVYYFTTDAPILADPIPVPVPTAAVPTRNLDDPTHKFVRDASSATTYNTTEKTADILFNVTQADKAVIMKDGVQFFTIDFNPDGTTSTALPITVNGIKIDSEPALPLGWFRIYGLPLTIGTNSYVIKGLKGPITTFKPLSIVRSNPPYQVLSPLLPQERVVNQNFVPVVIKADGADKVLIGKTEMNKVTENGEIYYTSEVSNLKPGINTIKYTVVRGTQSSNDQFDVNYANTDTIGAQYRASLSSSTGMKVFNNKVSLSFPKGTMLTPYNDTSTKIELFDKQQFLFGIADPLDGRTQKTYNHNGDVVQINSDESNFMRTMLNVPVHFGYASQLYWLDAGYYDTTQPGYVQLNGMQPYYGVEKNYNDPAKPYTKFNVWGRTMGTSWLKPTNRGTITLKYDDAVRDFASNRLSIMRFTMDNGQMNWVNIGGKVDSKSHTISASIDSFGYYAVFLNTYGFDDTESHDFARDDMELMFARGIMNSKDGSEFGAYEPTTRGEFAQMMVKALDLPLNYDPNNYLFLDVPHSSNVSPYWDWRYIETAGQKGIVRGVGTRQFAPDDKVSREQAATMIALAMNLKLGKDYELSKKNLDKIYVDSGQISYYARTAIEAVYQQKLMIGRTIANSDPKGKPLLVFEPQANITRAESAKVVANMMRKFNKL